MTIINDIAYAGEPEPILRSDPLMTTAYGCALVPMKSKSLISSHYCMNRRFFPSRIKRFLMVSTSIMAYRYGVMARSTSPRKNFIPTAWRWITSTLPKHTKPCSQLCHEQGFCALWVCSNFFR